MNNLKSTQTLLSKSVAAEFLTNESKTLTREDAECFTHEILTNERNTKLNLMLMMHKRGFEVLGYKDFKSYVFDELPMTYDAVIKQMIAAETTAKLFGIEYVGFYSDSAMRTLRRLPLQVQVQLVLILKNKVGKKPDEPLTLSELTKKAVDMALVEYSGNNRILRDLNKTLDNEDLDNNYHMYEYDYLAIFENHSEDEFIKTHGFSRWDKRSLNLLKKDELMDIEKDELVKTLECNWSCSNMLNHVNIYHSVHLEEMKFECMSSHANAVYFLASLYDTDIERGTIIEDEDEDEDEDEGEGEEILSLEDLLENEFFADTTAPDIKKNYNVMRDKVKKIVVNSIYKKLKNKNPKAAILMAISDELDLDELNCAQAFFSLLYEERAKDAIDDGEGFDDENQS
ncbi:hypothetical protein [Shewanella baltica]|uniref:Uncharacterized protein n=1 Tax=Shewanella baltica (strain OS155 / ATCC BAA-1091) TaxID=325240 RepID=A3D8G9_SHEB5|nr:hypothetical protein [Shewanella baltica]ABN63032.1 hypothetical protein Sbal_3556 [Shewanella baltica OS155]